MLKQDTIQKIEQLLKIKGLADAIKSTEEVDVAIDETIATFTEEEVKTLKSNSYKDGKKAGVEMEVDDLKKELNLDFQGKTVKGLAEALKKKTLEDAKIEPNQKVQELTEKVTTLQKTVGEYETQLAQKAAEVEGVLINTEIYKHIPAFGDNAPALGQDEIITLMKANGYEFKREDGKTMIYHNGKRVEDKLANPVEVKDVVGTFLKEKKLITETVVPSGRGGSNQVPPSKAGNLTELKKQFESQGKSLLGEEFSSAVQQHAKENPDFKME